MWSAPHLRQGRPSGRAANGKSDLKMPKRFRTTVTGSYPWPVQPADTLKKPTLSREAADEMIRWAVKEQADLGLDIVADGEGRRENMYYFVQKRVDGVSFDQMEYRSYGTAGFGIDIAAVVDTIRNPRLGLAHDWRVAREVAAPQVEVKNDLQRAAHAGQILEQPASGP